jgi:phosphate transport system substrate-binding protein
MPEHHARPGPQPNPGITLRPASIAVVHRSDGSGTTYIFSNYLSSVDPA